MYIYTLSPISDTIIVENEVNNAVKASLEFATVLVVVLVPSDYS